MIETILFNLLAFTLFFIIFGKLIKRNDTNYIYILAIVAFGIFVRFFSIILHITMPILIIIICYILSVALPIAVILLERKSITLSEMIAMFLSSYYFKKGNAEKARKILISLIEKYPESYYAHKTLGKQYEEEKKYDEAIAEYIRAREANEKDSDLQYKIAELLNKTQRKEQAEKALTMLLRKDSSRQEAAILLGDILCEQEKWKEAVNVYLQALKYHPESYELYYNLGMTYTMLNDFQSAKVNYEKAAQINTLLYVAQFSLAQIAMMYRELEEAKQYFINVMEDKEMEAECYFYLAYIAILEGDEEKAIQYLQEAVKEDGTIYERAIEKFAFHMIIMKIKRPTEEQLEETKDSKLKPREKQMLLHLKDMYELVGNLDQNDIKNIKIKKDIEKEREQE